MNAATLAPGEVLSVRIRKTFRDAGNAGFRVDVKFAVPPGFTILFGASGAGKTTLLDSIAGLQRPEEGQIAIGESILFDSATHVDVSPRQRSVGYLVQTLALFPHMTVAQNVDYGLARLDRGERERRRLGILESFRVADLARRRPGQISGGERQRVALARALVTQPRILLLDEPLTALDAATKSRIVDDLRAWNQQQGIPILYVTHNRQEVFALGEKVLFMEAGRILAQGLPQEVLGRPQLESVAQLVGFENIFDCEVSASHSELGTMTCRIASTAVNLEVPLVRVNSYQPVRVGVHAGDILLSVVHPQGLSARNLLQGVVASLERHDMTVVVRVNCGAEFIVHLTLGAQQSLHLAVGVPVWLVIKTYSCHVLQ